LEEIKKYISTRYQRYLDYADYHTSLAGLDQQGPDVLHEVIISILEKDPEMIKKLYNKTKNGLRELDYYILRMIKLNCHSMTSPYRFRYKFQVAEGVSPEDQEDHIELPDNRSDLTVTRYNIVRDIVDSLDICQNDKMIFSWKFFASNTWAEWEGPESKEYLTKTYKKILATVRYRLDMRKRAYTGHVVASRQRMDGIRAQYRWTLFPTAYNYSSKYQRAKYVFDKYSEKLNRITGNLNVEV